MSRKCSFLLDGYITSDSTSPWIPLPLIMCLSLPGRIRDFHPLEFTHAVQTKKSHPSRVTLHILSTYLVLISLDPFFVWNSLFKNETK